MLRSWFGFVLMAVAVRSCHYVNEPSSPLRTGPVNVRRILKRSGVRVDMCVRKSHSGRGVNTLSLTHFFLLSSLPV